MEDPDAVGLRRLAAQCDRSLTGHGERSPAALLAELPEDVVADRYGDGGVVEELEDEVATLLGEPAAVFLPSGTMAQQIALRIHADHRGRRTVAFHPACHLDQHEDRAFERLHGLVGRAVGDPNELLTAAALAGIAEPLAALVLELPQRDLGGRLPTWEELLAQTDLARQRGAARHLDGARLWQCPPAYGRPITDVTALFDTVYVSFYKDLGGWSGACLAGPADVMAQAREWRRRHGGTLFRLWPYAASALAGLRIRLPRMPRYAEHARAVAAALGNLERVRVEPEPPQTSMFHLHLEVDPDALRSAARRLAADDGIWTWASSLPTGSPGWRKVEVTVGDATLDISPTEFRDVVARLIGA